MKEKDDIKITNAELDEDNGETAIGAEEITIDELIEKLASLQKKAEADEKRANDMTETAQRIQAEFDNYRRRTIENNARLKSDAQGEVICKLLPVMDVIAQALSMIPDDSVRKGVEMIEGEILKLLASYEVTEIEAVGKEFDPRYHEAIMQAPATCEKEKDTVKEVFQKGYKMGERVIRPARVIVNK